MLIQTEINLTLPCSRRSTTEPPRHLRPLLQPHLLHPDQPRSHRLRHPDLQRQDPARGRAHHEPALLGPLLALRLGQRLPRRPDEAV